MATGPKGDDAYVRKAVARGLARKVVAARQVSAGTKATSLKRRPVRGLSPTSKDPVIMS
jgi:hypothetical protein